MNNTDATAPTLANSSILPGIGHKADQTDAVVEHSAAAGFQVFCIHHRPRTGQVSKSNRSIALLSILKHHTTLSSSTAQQHSTSQAKPGRSGLADAGAGDHRPNHLAKKTRLANSPS